MTTPVQGASATSQAYQAQIPTQTPTQPQAPPTKGQASGSSTQDQVSISENARKAAADNASAPGGSLVDRDHDGH